MKNTFIIAMFIFWGFIVAVVSAGYVVKQNRLAQESMQKMYTESLNQIVQASLSGKTNTQNNSPAASLPKASTQTQTAPVVKPSSPAVVTKPASVAQTGITMNDVAAHSTQSDCWIVINGNVYSVASYIPMHPGGARRIVNLCGGDATGGYDNQGHSGYADSLLGGYLVGKLQ